MKSISCKSKTEVNKPIFTIDIELVVFRHPITWPASMDGLAQLEYNYFELKNIEICVTPHTVVKIINKQSIPLLGFKVYKKIRKCKFYKDKPYENILTLTRYKSNQLWLKIRDLLWSEVNNENLSYNQKLDITQLFFNCIISGCSSHSAFLTINNHFHTLTSEIHSELGVCVMNPHQAWTKYQSECNLYIPDEKDVNWMWQHQHYHLGNFYDMVNKSQVES